MKLKFILVITFFWNLAFCQLEKFEIEFPRAEPTSEIFQDSLGYMWFHDQKEFFRYDGHQVEAMGLQKAIGKKKFDYNFTGDLILRGSELLFMNSDRVSAFNYQTKQITDVWQLRDDSQFDHLYKDDLGQTWIFTSHISDGSRPVFTENSKGDYELVFDLSEHIGNQGIFWDFEIEDDGNYFYIHKRLGGLHVIDMQGNAKSLPIKSEQDYAEKLPCSQFRLDNLNRLWRIYEKDVGIYNPKSLSFEAHPLSRKFKLLNNCNKELNLSLLNLRSIFTDRQSRIWLLCAASYLVMYDPATDQTLLFREPLIDQLGGGNYDIISLQEDRDGNLWGNNLGGVFKIRDKDSYFESFAVNTNNPEHQIYKTGDPRTIQKIKDFYHDFATKNTEVHSISEDTEGDIYFQDGTYTFKISHTTKKVEILPIFSPKEKVHLHFQDDIRIYASWDSYYKMDAKYQQTRLKTPVNYIDQIFKQSNGKIWLSGLLNQYDFMFGELDSSTLEFKGNYLVTDGTINFKDVKVNFICEGKQNELWLATDIGIVNIDQGTERASFVTDFSYQGKAYQIGKIVDFIELIADRKIWIKTKYEIALIDLRRKQILSLLPLDTGIHGENVQVIFDGDTAVWMGVKNGILYHNFSNNKEISVSSEGGIDTKGEVLVMKRLADHRIAMGTKNGLYIFHPADFQKAQFKASNDEVNIPVLLSSYSFTNGKSANTFKAFSNQISLNYDDRSLVISYSQNNYQYPNSRLFQHKLEGYDSDWSQAHISSQTEYSSLPPGEYLFRVKGNIGNGTWSVKELQVPITVKEAWFRTWWFFILVFVSLASILFLMLRYRFRLMLQRKLAIEKLRVKISSDLHDDVGTLLSGLAMQSEVLGLSMKGKSREKIEELGSLSRNAIERMRDIVWAMDSRRDKYQNLLDRMKGFMATQFSESNIQYAFELDGILEDEFISPDVRQSLYLIFKEAVTNALKHSNGDRIEIRIKNDKKALQMSIHDNGNGIENKLGDGLGMSNMAMRAQKIGGNLQITRKDGFQVLLEVKH